MTYEVWRGCVVVQRPLNDYVSGVWLNVKVVGRWSNTRQTKDEPCLRQQQQHSPTFSIIIITIGISLLILLWVTTMTGTNISSGRSLIAQCKYLLTHKHHSCITEYTDIIIVAIGNIHLNGLTSWLGWLTVGSEVVALTVYTVELTAAFSCTLVV